MSVAMSKELYIGVKIGAALGATFDTVLNTAESRVKKLGKTALTLKPKIDVSGAVVKYGRQLEYAKKKQRQFGDELPHMVGVISKLQKKYSDASREARKLGMSVKDIGSEHKALKSQANYALGAKSRAEGHKRNQGVRSEIHGKAIGVAAAVVSIGAPIREAIQFESAMSDVKKVVEFPTPVAFKAMKKDILNLSTVIPMSAEGIASIVASAGQAGMARKELIPFATIAAKVGVAFDMTADQTGESLAKIKTALGYTVEETSLFADAINHLSNNSASAAPDLLNFSRRVATEGKKFGFTATQTAAFGSAMIASGFQAEVAATSFRNMGKALTKGESATKAQVKAFKKLGLDHKKISKEMQNDAVGTTLKVLKAFKKLEKHEVAAVSSKLFGDEARALGPLLTNLGLIEGSLGLINKKSNYEGSAEREYAERAKTTAHEIQRFKNQITKLGVTIGSELLPTLNSVVAKTGEWIGQISDFSEKHPGVVKGLVGIAAGFVGMKVGILGLKYISTGISDLILGATSLIKVFGAGGPVRLAFASLSTKVFPALIAGIRTVGIAFATTPIGLVVSAIAIGAVMVVKHWDSVKAFFGGFWQGIKPTLQPMIDFFSDFGEVLAPVGKAISSVIGWFGDLLSPVTATKEGLDSARSAGEIFGSAVGGAISLIFNPIGALKDILPTLLPAFSAVKDYVVLKFGEIVTYLSSIPGEFVKLGENIIQGIADGIDAKFDVVKNKIKGIGKSIKDTFTFDLKIFSPSRVFRGYGENISEGLALGIDGKSKKAESNVINLADRVKKAGVGIVLGASVAMPAAASPNLPSDQFVKPVATSSEASGKSEPKKLSEFEKRFKAYKANPPVTNNSHTSSKQSSTSTVTNHNSFQMSITQNDGEPSEEFAERVSDITIEKMKEAQESSNDGRLYD